MSSEGYPEITAKKYHFPPTPLIPNSPCPLLHYPSILLKSSPSSAYEASPNSLPVANTIALRANNLFSINKWDPQWIYRYDPTQQAHYHSRVHECMAVLSGEASITFGAADSEIDAKSQESSAVPDEGSGHASSQGITLTARAGDVFVIPAGVAHKTHSVTAGSSFALLTPGDGHGITGKEGKASNLEMEEILSGVQLTGFTMFGAYPASRAEGWDFAVGGEDVGEYEKVWSIPMPECDPIYGMNEIGLTKLWA